MKWRDLALTVAVLLILAPYLGAQTQPIPVGFSGGAVGSPIKFPDGAVGSPSITFANETNSGFFRRGSGIVSGALAGAVIFDMSTGVFRLNDAQLAFMTGLGGTDVGIKRSGAATLSVANGAGNGSGALQTGSGPAGTVVLALPAGSLGFSTASTSSVGNTGQGARLVVVCGPTSGTASLLFYAGTTNTPVVLANAVGGGLIGC